MKISLKRGLWQALGYAAVLFMAGCASQMESGSSRVAGGSAYATSDTASAEAAPSGRAAATTTAAKSRARLEERPGLGTELGSFGYDPTKTESFYRRNKYQPDFVGQFFYNDTEGAKTMAEMSGNPSKRGGSFALNNGGLSIRVVSNGGTCAHYEANGRIIVTGEAGSEYSIELNNRSNNRIEALVSVDGLDTMTGKASSFDKRGYIIGKRESYSVRGFRQGNNIRNFRFGTVANSQAAVKGGERGARNVGVIGIAVYNEDEAAAHQARLREGFLRTDAKPF